MEIAGDGDAALFISGVDEAVEGFGGVMTGRENPDAVGNPGGYDSVILSV